MYLAEWKSNYNAETKTWSGSKPNENTDKKATSLGREIFKVLADNPENIGQVSEQF